MASKENCPPEKRRKLSLTLSRRQRFGETSREEILALEKVQVPKNTEVTTKWALKNLNDWFKDYQERNPDCPCPESILTPSASKDDLNKYLTIYITETRNKNGDRYPPRTIQALLSGILRSMRAENALYPNFFDKKDPCFKSFQTALDNLFKKLSADGIGADGKHTEGMTVEEESHLWTSKVLDVESPKGLLRAVFFTCGKCFCLRGGMEHRQLSVSQLKRLKNPDRYVYTENSSKNRPGGVTQLKLDHKSVTIVANTSVGERCPVFVLDKYISKLPVAAIEKDLFYCRPLSSVPKGESEPWYIAVPIGKNMLSNMVSDMCSEAGILGSKTNHSLRVLGATSLFDAGVPERIIQQRTGHRSIEGLRIYERVTDEQEKAVSKVLTGESKKFGDSFGEMQDKASHSDRGVGDKEQDVGQSSSMDPRGGISAQYNGCNINFYSMPPSYCPPFMPQPPPPHHSYYSPTNCYPYPPGVSTADLPSTSEKSDC